MKLSKRQLLLAAGLALAASTASADPLQTGFYVGANSGASFVTNQVTGTVSIFNLEEYDSVRARYNEENSIRGYNGGIFAGWNFYCDERWFHGVELSWDFFSNRGTSAHDLEYVNVATYGELVAAMPVQHVELDDDVDVKVANFEEIYDLEWALNLVFKPGVKVSDNTVFYGIVGASWASFDSQSSRISNRRHHRNVSSIAVSHNEEEHHDHDKDHDSDDDLWGFVLGAGLSTQVTHYLSFFGSYQYTYYGKTDLDSFKEKISDHRGGHNNLVVQHHDAPAFVRVKDRQVKVDTNVFKVGLAFNF